MRPEAEYRQQKQVDTFVTQKSTNDPAVLTKALNQKVSLNNVTGDFKISADYKTTSLISFSGITATTIKDALKEVLPFEEITPVYEPLDPARVDGEPGSSSSYVGNLLTIYHTLSQNSWERGTLFDQIFSEGDRIRVEPVTGSDWYLALTVSGQDSAQPTDVWIRDSGGTWDNVDIRDSSQTDFVTNEPVQFGDYFDFYIRPDRFVEIYKNNVLLGTTTVAMPAGDIQFRAEPFYHNSSVRVSYFVDNNSIVVSGTVPNFTVDFKGIYALKNIPFFIPSEYSNEAQSTTDQVGGVGESFEVPIVGDAILKVFQDDIDITDKVYVERSATTYHIVNKTTEDISGTNPIELVQLREI